LLLSYVYNASHTNSKTASTIQSHIGGKKSRNKIKHESYNDLWMPDTGGTVRNGMFSGRQSDTKSVRL
jgi:hypothetical protein